MNWPTSSARTMAEVGEEPRTHASHPSADQGNRRSDHRLRRGERDPEEQHTAMFAEMERISTLTDVEVAAEALQI